MKLFHVSDTHLGFSAFSRLDPERGINQREADFCDSFERFVDVCLREEPDIILHSGDLFDSVRPSNRAISFAFEQIKRISDAGIDFVAISGNHETPRLRETGSVFKILDHLPNCHFVFESGFKRIEMNGIEIFCHPHSSDEAFREGLSEANSHEKNGPRIVMMHVGIVGLGVFRTDEINELILKESDIDSNADYVALGHYHEFMDLTDNTTFAGSTERSSMTEAKKEKGFVEIDLETGARKFRALPTRRMIDLPAIDLKNRDASEARDLIIGELEQNDLDGAIVRISLKRISKEVQRDLDLNLIRRKGQETLNLELKIEREDEEEVLGESSSHIGSIESEFMRFVHKTSLEDEERKMIEALAIKFFSENEE